jgi:hypothetical protein
MLLRDTIKLETNIIFTLTDIKTGKVTEQRTHNVYLNYGRDWLLKLMSYSGGAGVPPAPLEDNRVYAMALGIGGNKQLGTVPEPVNSTYPGTNIRSGTDVTTPYLERPVRVKEVGPTDYWMNVISHGSTTFNPAPPPYYVAYFCTFGALEISYAPYYEVPLSEIGLIHFDQWDTHKNEDIADVYGGAPGAHRPQPIAYSTFYTLTKTAGVTLMIEWQIRLQ